MPDKFFEKIFKEFETKYLSVQNKIDSLDPDDKESTVNFYESFKQLVNIQSKTSKAYEENGMLSEDEYNSLTKAYSDFQNCSNSFIETQSGAVLYGIMEMNEYTEHVKALMIPVKQYAEDIMTEGPGVNLTEIYRDKRWIEDLFIDDPKKAERKNDPFVPFEPDSLSGIGTNIVDYLGTLDTISTTYNEHLRTVTGSENPYKAMEIRNGLIQAVMDEYYPEGKNPYDMSFIIKMHSNLGKNLHPFELNEISNSTIINKDFFDAYAEQKLDIVSLTGKLNESKVDETVVSKIMAAYEKIKLSPNNVGMTESQLDKLNKTSKCFMVFTKIRQNLEYEQRMSGISKDHMGSLNLVLNKCRMIESQFVKLLQQDNNATLPSMDDIGYMMDGLADYVLSNERFVGDHDENFMVKYAMDACKDLYEVYPSLKDRYTEKENAFKEKALNDFNGLYKNLAGLTHQQKIENTYKTAQSLSQEHWINDNNENYEKIYTLMLAKNKKFRDKEMQAARDILNMLSKNPPEKINKMKVDKEDLEKHFSDPNYLSGTVSGVMDQFEGLRYNSSIRDKQMMAKYAAKTLLMGTYFEKEMNANINYEAADPETRDYKFGYNDSLRFVVTGNKVPEADIGNLDKFAKEFDKSHAINTILNSDAEKISALLSEHADKVVEETMYNNSSSFMSKLDNGALTDIATIKKGPKKSNSDSYKRMTDQLCKLTRSAHDFGGLKDKDLGDTFNALKNYVETHNSEPFTDHGKARFNSAAKLLCDVGMKIKQVHPAAKDMCNEIDKIFKTTMIRSKVFRDACINKADEYGQKDLKAAAEIINANLKNEKKEMITGTLPDEKKVEAMLAKYTAPSVQKNM